MPISQTALEQCILTLLCFSPQAVLIAAKIEDSIIFSNRTNQAIGKAALAHIKQFGREPNGTIEILLENELRRGDEGKLLAQSLEIMKKQITEIQIDFVVHELDRYIQIRKQSNLLQQALEALASNDLEAAQELVYRHNVAVPVHGTPGILLQDPKQAFRFLDRDEYADYFSMGIDYLDKRGIRPERKTLITFIAAKGNGKTWWTTAIGKGGLLHRKKTLHITLEVSEEKMARRYLQSLFSLTKDEAKRITVPYVNRDQQGNETIEWGELERDSIIKQRHNVEAMLKAMQYYPPLIIKEFPTGTLSTSRLRMYLDSLAREKHFEPDLIIIDYPDLMEIDRASLRIDTGRQYIDLRGIFVERNAAGCCPTQGNKESDTAKLVRASNVSEDWSKVATSDGVLTYSRTEQEKRLGLARIFADRFREAADGFITLITQSYELGQFAIDSIPMNPNLSNSLQALNDQKN